MCITRASTCIVILHFVDIYFTAFLFGVRSCGSRSARRAVECLHNVLTCVVVAVPGRPHCAVRSNQISDSTRLCQHNPSILHYSSLAIPRDSPGRQVHGKRRRRLMAHRGTHLQTVALTPYLPMLPSGPSRPRKLSKPSQTTSGLKTLTNKTITLLNVRSTTTLLVEPPGSIG
jgi:hypothetical protein